MGTKANFSAHRAGSSLSGGVADDLIDAIDHVLDVALVQPGEGDTTRLQQIDVMLLNQALALRGRQACEREHADLISDVVPRPGRALLLQALPQQSPDFENAVRHALQLNLPRLQA